MVFAKLLALICALWSAFGARIPSSKVQRAGELVDCYSKYDKRPMVLLTPCTSELASRLSTSVRALGCTVLSKEGFTLRAGACGRALAICESGSAADLERMFGESARILRADAGDHLRRLSGVPEEPHSEIASSLVDVTGDVTGGSRFYAAWRDLDAREKRLETIVKASGGSAVLGRAGKSVQGRDIRLVRFTGKGYKPGMPKVVLTYQVHAREWITGMSGMYAVEKLAARAKDDPSFLEGVEVVVAPMVNPDGFVFSSTRDRFHRKNMRKAPESVNLTEDPDCEIGVDLNRNAPTAWKCDVSSESDPCEETFCGEAALSEPEAQAVVKLMEEAPMSIYIDVHSFSQYIMSSWMHTKEDPPRKQESDDLGKKIQAAVQGKHNKDYKFGQGGKILYTASGTFADHATTLGALSYTIELRPRAPVEGEDDDTDLDDEAAFAPGPEHILPAAEECFEGVLAAISYAKQMSKQESEI